MPLTALQLSPSVAPLTVKVCVPTVSSSGVKYFMYIRASLASV